MMENGFKTKVVNAVYFKYVKCILCASLFFIIIL